MKPFDTEETDRLLMTTKAVRRRLDLTRPVEREKIVDCIRLAPTRPTRRTPRTGGGSSSTIPRCARRRGSSTGR